MTATNKPMTGAQLDELMAVAMRMQSDSEKMGERSVSMFAYAVQVAVLEIRETRSKYEELQSQNADLAVQLANAESKCREMAVESVSKYRCLGFFASVIKSGEPWTSVCEHEYSEALKNPSTDSFLAEVRSKARNEGINYAAGRLAAAFNHGFVDKPLAEVCDVVHMILDTKEELAGSMIPAVDGLSGEYAEAFLKDSAAQLRKGAAL